MIMPGVIVRRRVGGPEYRVLYHYLRVEPTSPIPQPSVIMELVSGTGDRAEDELADNLEIVREGP